MIVHVMRGVNEPSATANVGLNEKKVFSWPAQMLVSEKKLIHKSAEKQKMIKLIGI